MCVTPTSPATNGTPVAPQFDDQRTLLPLPKHFLAALPLSATEQQQSAVFILGSEYHDENIPQAQCVSRLAICRLVPATEWGQLAEGSAIIYTERYSFTEEEQPGKANTPTLCSHAGVMKLNDAKRRVLHTAAWVGHHNDHLDHDYSEVHELWQVKRFIALTLAQ